MSWCSPLDVVVCLMFMFMFNIGDYVNAISCECGNEPSGSIKRGEFLD
jgi:hypothetical protein